VAELGQLRGVAAELRRQGGWLMAISVDRPADLRKVVELVGPDTLVLSDPEAKVIRDYGLLHEQGGLDGEDIAIPAHILIARDGRIIWKHVAQRIQDRPDPADVLTRVQALSEPRS